MKKIVGKIVGVKKVKTIKAQYLGNYVHVWINVVADGEINLKQACKLEDKIRKKVESRRYKRAIK